MRRIDLHTALLGVLLLGSGCVNAQNTRMPTLAAGDPAAERQSYDYHDPMQERETGPLVERPRGFDRQRTEPRRTIEKQMSVQGTRAAPADTGSRYPDTVR